MPAPVSPVAVSVDVVSVSGVRSWAMAGPSLVIQTIREKCPTARTPAPQSGVWSDLFLQYSATTFTSNIRWIVVVGRSMLCFHQRFLNVQILCRSAYYVLSWRAFTNGFKEPNTPGSEIKKSRHYIPTKLPTVVW